MSCGFGGSTADPPAAAMTHTSAPFTDAWKTHHGATSRQTQRRAPPVTPTMRRAPFARGSYLLLKKLSQMFVSGVCCFCCFCCCLASSSPPPRRRISPTVVTERKMRAEGTTAGRSSAWRPGAGWRRRKLDFTSDSLRSRMDVTRPASSSRGGGLTLMVRSGTSAKLGLLSCYISKRAGLCTLML